MGKIQIMDEWLSNKIAAGEVVERPSSVVKELVENAIDAGSTSIEIFLEEAGLHSIQVIDNGSGMDEEDALKSFSRHATSKIEKEQDLFRIRTLGFRGEALASIASVSKLTLRTSDGNGGVHLYMEGGHLKEHQPTALRRGTDITVAQLFFNTPARLKYLKTIQTELGHTIDFVNRIALGYPTIAVKLVHNGQTLLQTNGRGQVQQVLAAIYGAHNAKKMLPFEGENQDYKIHGFASLPEVTRASKNYMSLFVNGRWVKHFVIQKAIIDAYHTYLPIERFPIVLLYVEGDPQLTDVNVHPAKHQVRLSKEPELLKLIEDTIRSAIREVIRIPLAEKKEKPIRTPTEQMNIWNPAPAMQPTFNEDKLSTIVERLSSEASIVKEPYAPIPTQQQVVPAAPPEPENSEQHSTEDFHEVPTIEEEMYLEESTMKEVESKRHFPQVEIVGQIHGTYIVAQMEDGFYLIDQHAAQERIKYEYFRDKVGEVNANERQTLLMPLTFHYAADEALRLKESMEALEEVGVFLEEFGLSSFVVREYPTWFPKGEEQEIIEELIEQVLSARKTDIKKLREDAAIMMSCKKSIKANHYLNKEQMERLINDLRNADNPFTCPHGRPVLIHFTSYEVEKMFKRVM
ncbi:DNA mismatch repair protein mutL [Solibacillus isronensis B3W22]|uniref:DNA mismatch repair protein MutL n=1 Tax=Solibacillus isronensis B3W22 TaxID=1224748 RepID=K1KWF5_9BACL|nr:DNA mismatch repair endonuclease MutL [Solibacillus isronensis]AMO86108.1 DNA mismatch repair protein MutL [Solibacillus silvestris]EKB44192.1 DNA mismatch repair protein mutL [Solibacillus isronensis B3W22]